MSALTFNVPLPSSFHLRSWKLWQDRKLRWYTATVLAADALGYGLVFLLNRHGVGSIRSNLYVSYGMTPLGLALNVWALTGGWRLSGDQFVAWFTYWLPSSTRNVTYSAWLVSTFELNGVQARLAVGLTFFLLDYAVKRWIIFGRYGELARFYLTKAWLWLSCGALVKAETA